MGASHPSPSERYGVAPSGIPEWYRPKGTKTAFDFPKAKEGKPDRYEFNVGARPVGKPRRLDRVLIERFVGFSRSFFQKMIKDGKVLIDGKPTKASWHVMPHEVVTVILPPATKHLAEEIPLEVIYRDKWMLGLSKPSGIIIHPARGNKTGTLYNGLLNYFKEERAENPSFHIGTVHRLDEETSGVIVFALDKKAHGELTRQFEFRKLQKTYLCIAHGVPDFQEKIIDAPLGVDPTDRHRAAVDGLDARPAKTTYKVLAVSPCGKFSFMRAYPHTGRSHQIRIHAKALGHPLVGDELYEGKKYDAAFGELVPRVCLHAESLALKHPGQGHPMMLTAPLPADMVAMAAQLGLKPNL